MNTARRIEVWPVDRLRPYARNARTHSPEQIAKIAASIAEFGFTNPILVDSEDGIIAGHGRLAAAQSLGLTEVPVIPLDHLTDAQRRALVIADNKLAELAGWDQDLLAEELAALQDDDFDLSLIGFSDEELADLLPDDEVDGEASPGEADHVPGLPVDPVTRPGDVWLLGNHRVMCGDSTDPLHVDRLMAGGMADLVFTDPPYGMMFSSGRQRAPGSRVKTHGMIMNDDLGGDDLMQLVLDALVIAVAYKTENASVYVCLTWRTYSEFRAAIELAGLKPKACIVWDKKSIGIGTLNYRPQHEFIFYHEAGNWYGPNNETDVWSFSRGNTGAYVHPTQKPVELIERAVTNSSDSGAVVLDCFGGSGSTLIACERTGRTARLMELDPKYCDVIVRRWQEFTGHAATLDGDGRTFVAVESERLPSGLSAIGLAVIDQTSEAANDPDYLQQKTA